MKINPEKHISLDTNRHVVYTMWPKEKGQSKSEGDDPRQVVVLTTLPSETRTHAVGRKDPSKDI